MITTTAQRLIDGALQDLGVLALGQELTGPEGEDALEVLNHMVDALGIERAMLFKLVRTLKTLADSTASYTIGSDGSIVLARPTRLSKAGLILDTSASPTVEVEIDVLDDDAYARWPSKTEESSAPRAVFYDRGFDGDGYGTIYPLPIPNVGTTQLVLYTPGGVVAQFAELATEYEAPEGLALVLRTNLALHLKPRYPQATVSAELKALAASSKRTFKAAHQVVPSRDVSPVISGRGGRFDMNTGGFR